MEEFDRRMQMLAAGAWLKAQRERAGLTQKAFADLVEMDQSQLSKIERGVGEPTDDRAQAIAGALRMDLLTVRRHLGLWVPPDTPDESGGPTAHEIAQLRGLLQDALDRIDRLDGQQGTG